MKHLTLKKCCMFLFAMFFSSTLFAEGVGETNLVSQQQRSRSNNNNRNMNQDPNTWMPYYLKTKDTEPLSAFYQQTVGIGFLYFAGVKGNLNSNLPASGLPKRDGQFIGKIGYNRTPVFEMIIGRDIWWWMKIALSYTHQGQIWAQIGAQPSSVVPATAATNATNYNPGLSARVRLDAALFRVYFMSPYMMVWKNMYVGSYLSAGVGPGWQTWSRISVFEAGDFKMKVSANCVFTADLGAKLRRAVSNYVMSFTAGCKFTIWGQARQMGLPIQQDTTQLGANNFVRGGLSNPIRISTVYQFAPYIGVQFNF